MEISGVWNKSLVLLILAEIVLGICPSGYIRSNDTCYLFSHDKEAWVNAANLCKDFDSNLAEIETASEDAFISEEVRRLNVPFWIGGNDIRTKGEWVWWKQRQKITGYSNWLPGSPNNINGDENCILLNYNGALNNVFWDDGTCHVPLNYICELDDSERSDSISPHEHQSDIFTSGVAASENTTFGVHE